MGSCGTAGATPRKTRRWRRTRSPPRGGSRGRPRFPSLRRILGGTVSSNREPKRSVVMDNRLVDATWTYHNGTKHSYESLRTSAHFLSGRTSRCPSRCIRHSSPSRCPATSRSPHCRLLLPSGPQERIRLATTCPISEPSRGSYFSLQASPGGGPFPGKRSCFAPPPVRARSITSNSISSAVTCRISAPESTTSGCTTSRCEGCAPEITEAPS